MQCWICQGDLREVYASKKPISVSSDNFLLNFGISLYVCVKCGHLQKFPKQEILNHIYANYKTDSILPNQEQVKFDSNVPKSNSYRLLENSLDFIPKKESLKILDYGAGGGGMLQSFLAFFPNVSAYAYDVSSHNRTLFVGIAKEFYTNLEQIKQKFDFISAVYCVEHFCDVKKEILKIKDLLCDDGVLMVQIPDVEQNLWDIFTYDHIHHFSKESLSNLFCSLGFSVMFPSVQLDRGITLLAKKGDKSLKKSNSFVYPKERIEAHFEILDEIIAKKESVAVFGSAVNSTFIGGYLEMSLAAFLDEDSRKIGKEHLGVKIIAPSIWDKKVIMPYGHIKNKVQAKYHFNSMVEVF